jgi:FkbM family methyltransferase
MPLLIEVGAFDGHDSLKYHNQGYDVFTFEPKKDLYENLYERTKHITNYTVIPKAVCLTNGTTMFNICKEGGASSILPFKTEDELEKHWTCHRTDIHYSGISYEVETTRMDTFIEENNLTETVIDYLHIDAQGVDLDVLKSFGTYLKNVKEGVIETVLDLEKSIYVGQVNNVENTILFLKENNFIVTNIASNDPTNCEYNLFFKNQLM